MTVFAALQDSPNKHGVMGSKSVGEPPLLLSTSALTAFSAAIAAAAMDLTNDSDITKPGTFLDIGANSGTGPDTGGKFGTGAGSSAKFNYGRVDGSSARSGNRADVSVREAAVQRVCAPVTVRAVRAAVGSLHLPGFLDQYA